MLLAKLLSACPKLTSVDVRGNESLGEVGTQALIDFMSAHKAAARGITLMPRSFMGVGGGGDSTLTIPKHVPPFECRLLCCELETYVFSEGMSASMGGTSKANGTTLNRRGGHAGDAWQPLIWACRDGHVPIANQFLHIGHDINKTESVSDKGSNAWGPIHWAASKGHMNVLEMLISHNANVLVKDKHGSTPKAIAEKQGRKEAMELLQAAEEEQIRREKRPAGRK